MRRPSFSRAWNHTAAQLQPENHGGNHSVLVGPLERQNGTMNTEKLYTWWKNPEKNWNHVLFLQSSRTQVIPSFGFPRGRNQGSYINLTCFLAAAQGKEHSRASYPRYPQYPSMEPISTNCDNVLSTNRSLEVFNHVQVSLKPYCTVFKPSQPRMKARLLNPYVSRYFLLEGTSPLQLYFLRRYGWIRREHVFLTSLP